MPRIKFSVIVTVFNRELLVLRALESLAAQTYRDFEVLIIDDASSDFTEENILHFQENSRLDIHFKKHTSNKGQNAAINSALELVTGDYVAFLDSDDVWMPHFLEEFANHISGLALGTFGFHYCRLVNGPAWDLEGIGKFEDVLSQGYLSALGTLVVRSDNFRAISPLPERLFINDMCQDDYICLELARRFSFTHLPKELYLILGDETKRISSMGPNFILGWSQFITFYRNEIVTRLGNSIYVDQVARIGMEIIRSRKIILLLQFNRRVLSEVPTWAIVVYFYRLTRLLALGVLNKAQSFSRNFCRANT